MRKKLILFFKRRNHARKQRVSELLILYYANAGVVRVVNEAVQTYTVSTIQWIV